ncbi:hypothetical protein FS837_007425 [Tulasnella sp. UAMH 9824]|nr:hypothetical protein FS837_007425 [Tulasnella sp. UAMH 9824]
MVLTAASGTRVNSAKSGDIELLSKVFTDLSAILAYKKVNHEWRGLHSVRAILSEALSYLDADEEPRTSGPLEPDSDAEDETWVELWEVQQLFEWTLLEARAAGLPKDAHELRRFVGRLERLITTRSTPLSANAEPQAEDHAAEITTQCGFKQQHQSNFISLLPTELLCKIFEYACAPRSLTLFSPLILSHVNAHFRSIVLDMPSLWSTIDDTFPIPIAKLYFERSIGAPLDVRIGSNGPPAVEDVTILELFDYLERHAHRLKALKMVTDDWDIMGGLDRMMVPGPPLDSLEKLEFGCYGNPQPTGIEIGFTLGEGNCLQELHLWGHTLDDWIDAFPTALRRLQLSEDCLLFGDPERVVTAGRLVELKFIRIDWVDMIEFARLIHTPALNSLSVVVPSSTVNIGCLVNLVKSSKGILSLEICDYDMTSKHWSEIFKHLPSLTHLRVRASYSSDEDLQALAIAQTLPNLTSITLDNELRLTTLLIEQMARTHPKLESIALRGWDPSNVSVGSLEDIGKVVKNIFVETFMTSPEECYDEETERDLSDDLSTDSEGSWLSGDEDVVVGPGDT